MARTASPLLQQTSSIQTSSFLLKHSAPDNINMTPSPFTQQGSQNYDGPGKTTVNFLNEEVGFLMIDAYSRNGFRLNNDMVTYGPIAIFPGAVVSWHVETAADITQESLELFFLVHPKPDIVIVGVGDRGTKIDFKLVHQIKKKGLNVEFLETEHAISTYNYMCSEQRAVAAALIPPQHVRKLRDGDSGPSIERASEMGSLPI